MARRDWYCEDVLSGHLEVRRIFEDDHALAFHHPKPLADIHVVVVPKAHVSSLLDQTALDGVLLRSMVRAVQVSASETGLVDGDDGFYVRTNQASPAVTPHLHWHIFGPGAGQHWPGF